MSQITLFLQPYATTHVYYDIAGKEMTTRRAEMIESLFPSKTSTRGDKNWRNEWEWQPEAIIDSIRR